MINMSIDSKYTLDLEAQVFQQRSAGWYSNALRSNLTKSAPSCVSQSSMEEGKTMSDLHRSPLSI